MIMTASERIRNFIAGKPVDRLPVIEWATWWHLTIERWRTEGLPAHLKKDYQIHEHFGLDECLQTWVPTREKNCPSEKHFGEGIIKNREDYLALKPYLYPDPTKVYNKNYFDEFNREVQKGTALSFFTVDGFFMFARGLFGIENHFYSFFDQAELLKELSEDYMQHQLKVFEFLNNEFSYDFMTFAEDMSYNHGPMISKDLFDEFLAPYYNIVIPQLKKMNIPALVDSDGDITEAVDWYAEVGADGMFPLEKQAGTNVAKCIEKQPQMTFMGHFDKLCMKYGEEAMRAEFERVLPLAKKGKLIISCDHQTPPDVSYETYKIYVKLFKEYAQKIKD